MTHPGIDSYPLLSEGTPAGDSLNWVLSRTFDIPGDLRQYFIIIKDIVVKIRSESGGFGNFYWEIILLGNVYWKILPINQRKK